MPHLRVIYIFVVLFLLGEANVNILSILLGGLIYNNIIIHTT